MVYHQSNKVGFSAVSIPEIPAKNSHVYQKLLSSVQEQAEEEKSLARTVQLKLKGQWTKWCSFVRIDLSWKSTLSMPPSLLSFCFGATYDTLPLPSNLCRWNITMETSCKLCYKQICTTVRILGACKFALPQGRFNFWHDSVLQVLVSLFQSFLSSYTISKTNCNTSAKFVKAESKRQK